MTKIGLRVKREALRLSREKLARKADVSASLVALIEGGYVCSDEYAQRIAGALGCEPADLFAREDGR